MTSSLAVPSYNRYLVLFSYIGTHYNGLQRQVGRLLPVASSLSYTVDTQTVQGIIELGLNKILKTNDEVKLNITSRTDSGVHALSSSAHFDIPLNSNPQTFDPIKICRYLNGFLNKTSTEIRIRDVIKVPSDFQSRNLIKSRTYCYRIAVPQHYNTGADKFLGYCTESILPINEINRCTVILPPIDFSLIQKSLHIFLGNWNFALFSKQGKAEKNGLKLEDYFKTITRISLTNVNSFYEKDSYLETDYYSNPLASELQFYDFHIEGSGFLRRQVRRMVGSFISIGKGLMKEEEILHMLQNPTDKTNQSKISGIPSDGLYLKSVNYKTSRDLVPVYI